MFSHKKVPPPASEARTAHPTHIRIPVGDSPRPPVRETSQATGGNRYGWVLGVRASLSSKAE